jgi:DNA-binding NarL/FixJ family response regulator
MTIVLADDHPVFRDGLSALIGRGFPGAKILVSDTFENALAQARGLPLPPRMLVFDLFFARRSIMIDLPALRREFSRTAIVIVSMAEDQATIDTAMGFGVNGYVSKAIEPEEMMGALRAVLDGEQVISISGAAAIDAPLVPSLSDRQLAVLQHIAVGGSNKEIAQALNISPFTVRIHVSALFRSLGVHTRSAAVSKAVAEGILNL